MGVISQEVAGQSDGLAEEGGTFCRGIEVEPESLIAVLDGLRLGFARFPLYSLLFHCRMLGGELRGHPLETRAVGFFGRDNLPWPLAGANRWVDVAFNAIDGKAKGCDFDPPRTPPWRGD